MSETTFRLARLGEDAAIIDFINDNFDMRLPLLNRPELYHHYYAGRGGVPQFAVAEEDGAARITAARKEILVNLFADDANLALLAHIHLVDVSDRKSVV